jgi:predicted ABC-type ATPase
MAKWMWIIAGPNGAGKSTFTSKILEAHGHGLVKLNADERTLALRAAEPDAPLDLLNLRAAQEIDAEVADNIANGRSFLVETVLSSDKYRDDVEAAKAAGFKIGLIYVTLHPPELSPARVGIRVTKGGHAVAYDTAIKRYHRSHEQLQWFAQQADTLMVFDNSIEEVEPRLVASRADGKPIEVHLPGVSPAADQALRPATGKRSRKRKRSADPS